MEVVATDRYRDVWGDRKRLVEELVTAGVGCRELVAVLELDTEQALRLTRLEDTSPIGNLVEPALPDQLADRGDRVWPWAEPKQPEAALEIVTL